MLILLFRGIFLMGILSWYSANVWKMIDVYFKERFDEYLQREYQKYPKMRDHVGVPQKSNKDSKESMPPEEIMETKKTTSPIDYEQRSCKSFGNLGEEVCPIDGLSMEKMAGDRQTGSGSLLSTGGDAIADGRSSESEVIAKGVNNEDALIESSATTYVSNVVEDIFLKDEDVASVASDKLVKSTFTAEAITIITDDLNENVTSRVVTSEAESSAITTRKPDEPSSVDSSKTVAKKITKRKLKSRKRQPIRTKAEEEKEARGTKKKLRVKTIFFTEEDFREAKMRGGWQDYDFTEFDDEDEDGTSEPPEGILVSQLPFKPRADIGKLERVSDDEFCPLTLEDEANCDKVKTWP